MGSPSSEPALTDPVGPRIPSPLQAFLVWLTAAATMLGASVAVLGLATAVVVARGENAARTLMDPARSPLTTSTGWIALGTLANELAVVVTLAIWWFILKPERRVVFPLGRPPVLGVIGALLVVFGLAPLAEAAGELMHRLIGNDVTSSLIVVNAARNATPAGLALLLFALAIMPAFAEEALFRGLLTAPFEQRFALGLLVPSALFGIFHLEPTQVAGTVILGIGFGLSRLCTGTLVTGAIAHAVYNTAVVITVRYSDAVAQHQLAIGPIVAGLSLALLGAGLLWRERRLLHARRSGGRPDLPSWSTFE